jgi:hypothetical protein
MTIQPSTDRTDQFWLDESGVVIWLAFEERGLVTYVLRPDSSEWVECPEARSMVAPPYEFVTKVSASSVQELMRRRLGQM